MFTHFLAVATAALTGLASAQNFSTSGPLAIDPSSVSLDIRTSWCMAQMNSCPKICGAGAYPNTCVPDDLSWTCTCTNGNQPNISDYESTMPYFVCLQWREDCTAAHPNDPSGQADCQSVTCGSRDPNKARVAIASGSSSASAPSSTQPHASSAHASKASQSASTTTTDSTAASGAQSTSAPNQPSTPADKGLGRGARTGIGVGVGVGLVALLAVLIYLLWSRRRKSKASRSTDAGSSEKETGVLPRSEAELENPPSELPTGHMAQELPARHGVSELARSGSGHPAHELPARHGVSELGRNGS